MGGTKELSKLIVDWRTIIAIEREKFLLTFHSCISVTDNVKINEQYIRIVTGPLYVHTEFEPI